VQGQCQFEGCSNGTKCCGTGCAACCEDSECDDGIACTKDTCGSNGCSSIPDDTLCMGQLCDPQLGGCIECHSAADCNDNSACTTDSCNPDTHKCLHVSACGKYQVCNAGTCAECATDSDCQGGVITQAAEPYAAAAGCAVSRCVKGACQATTEVCTGLESCCPPIGCAIRCAIAQ
jgi:hypothetical protein